MKQRSPGEGEIATLLAQGKVVAVYQGRSEFGPRALGNRSLIADPRSKEMRDHLNERIKRREWFRPFAPMVREKDEATFFERCQSSPNMQFIWPVREEYHEALSAVTDVGGTARSQSVTPESNPLLYQLLGEFGAITNIPVLLNTSFNCNGEPIVETPRDAVQTFLRSEIDALLLENVLITRDD